MLSNVRQDTVNDLDFLTIIKHEIICLMHGRLSDYSAFLLILLGVYCVYLMGCINKSRLMLSLTINVVSHESLILDKHLSLKKTRPVIIVRFISSKIAVQLKLVR